MIGDAVAKGECVSSRVLVWCLLAPSRGDVLLLGETWSAELPSETRVYFTALALRTRTPGARAL